MRLPTSKAYPKEMHVNEETYTIKFVPIVLGDKDVYGCCDPETHMIYIKSGMSKSQTFRTFIHETLHAMEFEYELKIKHTLVYQLEKIMGDFFLSNF